MYKPKTALLRRSTRSNNTTPVDFTIKGPAISERAYLRTASPHQSRKSTLRKISYLPMKMLERQMLDSQMNYVFRKVSMIRTDQKKGISLSRKSRTHSTIVAFWMIYTFFVCIMHFEALGIKKLSREKFEFFYFFPPRKSLQRAFEWYWRLNLPPFTVISSVA